MSKDLQDKVVLITGAAGGIGRATAIAAAEAGAIVVITDRDEAGSQQTAEMIAELSPRSYSRVLDVTNEASVQSVIAEAVEQFGRIDCAFNNAGIEYQLKPIQALSLEEWNRAFAINVTGVFLCMKHEIQAMLKSGAGSIVNTASGFAMVAGPCASEYVASKHAVLGASKAAAADMGPHGIRVNAVCPGAIDTAMMDRLLDQAEDIEAANQQLKERHFLGRKADPREVAEAVIWLLSDKASYVTGSGMAVDGGYTAN